MPLIHYLKKNLIKLCFFALIQFVGYSQNENKLKTIKIIRIGLITDTIKSSTELSKDTIQTWELNYIIIDRKIYSGDILNGSNFTCIKNLNNNYVNKITLNNSFEELEVLKDTLYKFPYKRLKTSVSFLDKMFIVSCVSIRAKYILLPCNVTTPDFLFFLFKEYNGIHLYDLQIEKLKKSKVPNFFIQKIKKNKRCLEKLQTSYLEYENCVFEGKKQGNVPN